MIDFQGAQKESVFQSFQKSEYSCFMTESLTLKNQVLKRSKPSSQFLLLMDLFCIS